MSRRHLRAASGAADSDQPHQQYCFLHLTEDASQSNYFLQRVSIACYAERCISYSKFVRPSVRLSVRHTLALCQNDSSYDHGSSL